MIFSDTENMQSHFLKHVVRWQVTMPKLWQAIGRGDGAGTLHTGLTLACSRKAPNHQGALVTSTSGAYNTELIWQWDRRQKGTNWPWP